MSTAKGQEGEARASRYLRRRGYKVVDRNVRAGRGELDIVARKGELLVFVEVKSYQNREQGLLAVHEDKCDRLRSAASAYLGRHRQFASLQCRFDLIILTPNGGINPFPKVEHLQDVFR
ncbi:MAG TPA: YraN family protein [Mariprofundaceae bacterium]|nr:YraN family protein [Mariprofundaceae bacterium]